jgi:adenine-specific DNA-methyltransferase
MGRPRLPKARSKQLDHRLLCGDASKVLDLIKDRSCRLVISSPPYNIGKPYERDCRRSIDEYFEWLSPIVKKLVRKVTPDGHLCWQVGNYVKKGQVFPLDYFFYQILSNEGWVLRNRIIWHFNFGLHAKKRFSGRYETLLWFTQSEDYRFQLEPVLVPQLYPGKRHSNSRSEKAGTPSGNPKGKNPSDFWSFDPSVAFIKDPIWELPNVKANHPEKTTHPCQFPSELVERCVLALTEPGDTVLDPFVGAGTSVIAAAMHGRTGIGIDKDREYIHLAKRRLRMQQRGKLATRPCGRPIRRPKPDERVATVPQEWLTAAE